MLNKIKSIAIVGSGFSGLSAACYAAKAGFDVSLYEKNSGPGGRARQFSQEGFVFDMGPSWYWMPDVFEKFFNDFGKSTSDYYDLIKLDPGFQIFFGNNERIELPASLTEVYDLFEKTEPGSAGKLKEFLKEGEEKYRTGMLDFAYKPSLSFWEYVNGKSLKGLFGIDLFKPMDRYVRRFFKDDKLIKLMEFPVLFLGAMPKDIPALYSLMNYSAIHQGTYYPQGGMYKIVEAMYDLAKSLGVKFLFDHPVIQIKSEGKKVTGVETKEMFFAADAVIASADYHHVEKKLLSEGNNMNYKESYWQQKVMAPSSLIFYLGVNKKVRNLLHHNLFFDSDFETHSREIYQRPQWPTDPLFYVCCPSKTDPSVAPEGMENLFILVPIASGLLDTDAARESYFKLLIKRIEKETGDKLESNIVFKKSYCINNFMEDYNSYKGNAYGLANTLRQTAFLKPKIKNKQLDNLYYAGQLTVPGPGVPPALISGKIAAEEVSKHIKTK